MPSISVFSRLLMLGDTSEIVTFHTPHSRPGTQDVLKEAATTNNSPETPGVVFYDFDNPTCHQQDLQLHRTSVEPQYHLEFVNIPRFFRIIYIVPVSPVLLSFYLSLRPGILIPWYLYLKPNALF